MKMDKQKASAFMVKRYFFSAGLFVLSTLCSLHAGIEGRLGVPFGMFANSDNSGIDATPLVASAGSFESVIWQWPETHDIKPRLRTISDAARAHGLKLSFGISPTSLAGLRTDLELPSWVQSGCGLTPQTVTFSNACLRAAFVADVVDIATTFKPESFHLATEINTLFLRENPTEYLEFASLYQEAAAAVKVASPRTKVFVTFQYELQKLLQNIPGETVDQIWDNTLNPFRGSGTVSSLDYVGFTTYPSSSGFLSGQYTTPLAMPTTYYQEASLHLQGAERAVFTEIGWPSEGSGSESEQQQFVQRLPELLAPAEPAFVTWLLLHDIPPGTLGFGVDITSTGLRRSDGTPKPAWNDIMAVQSTALPGGSFRVGSTGGKGVVHPMKGERAEIEVNPTGAGTVEIRIYDLAGLEVSGTSFVSSGPGDANNLWQWNAKTPGGDRVASGIYVVFVKGPGVEGKKKLAIYK